MDSCTTIRMYGNQNPARSASATVEPSCATRWSARTHPTAPTPSSQTESAALSAQMPFLRVPPPSSSSPILWSISFVAPPNACHLFYDHQRLTNRIWTGGPKPACFPEDLKSEKNRFGFTFSFHFIFNVHSFNYGVHLLLGKSGNACIISQHAYLYSDSGTALCRRASTYHVSQKHSKLFTTDNAARFKILNIFK